MVFSSQTFLFFFLPLAGLCVLIRSKPVQNALLLIASLIFYAWGEPKMVVLMVLVTLIAYGSGFARFSAERSRNAGTDLSRLRRCAAPGGAIPALRRGALL